MGKFLFFGFLTFNITCSGDVVDFNSMTSFDSTFSQTLAPTASSLADGIGLGGSRGVAYTGSTASDLRVYSGQLIHPNTTAWETSIYFRNNDILSLANPMIGFIGQDPGYGGFVSPDRTTPSIYLVAQANTLWLLGTHGNYVTDANILPIYKQSSWYQLSLRVDYVGAVFSVDTYNIHGSLSESDGSGSVGAEVAQLNHTLSTVEFQGVDDLYGFFGVNRPGFAGAMDNFVVSVPEPSSTFLLVVFGSIAVFGCRFGAPSLIHATQHLRFRLSQTRKWSE
jgi:hypothetical protein